ncbi:MAG TPA: DNA polymerase, partial [Hanamia sp.]|nr:DNA polymerase [Hanamia sp.]
MKPLTTEQLHLASSNICHICNQIISPADIPCLDHDHLTGEFRGVAHNRCNLNYKVPHFLPIFFHNLSNFDAHLFIKELAFDDEQIEILPLNKERYISITKHLLVNSPTDGEDKEYVQLRFLDSFRFMASSLDKLAGNLQFDEFVETSRNFASVALEEESLKLLMQKGVFPYSYVSSFEKLEERELPCREKFYDELNKSDISETDYERALNVWKLFKCQTLGEYSDLYLKTDVLLLTDVFENFRNVCVKTYDLDPAHFYTAPGLTWDAMLKFTKVELELFTDIDMLHLIRKSIRGGTSDCSHRYARANNPYMGDKYDPTSSTSYLLYVDFNNLYGWSL